WHLGMVSPSVMFAAESVKIPVVYHISDYWLENVIKSFRVASSSLKGHIKSITISRKIRRLGLEHLIFVSNRLKELYTEGGVPLKDTRIIYHGIDTKQYPASENYASEDSNCKLLYVGRLSSEKGVQTIVESMSILTQKGYERFTLSIVGGGSSDYVSELQRLVEEKKLQKRVTFLGKQPREKVTDFFQNHDMFIFSSIWEEPFSIVLLKRWLRGWL
ncbi:glycosyltransferase family 4 protein, partial [bacterium]|nr:glycosyltransferase family 4 protein [bacterium]